MKTYSIQIGEAYGHWLVKAKGPPRSCKSLCLCLRCNQVEKLVRNLSLSTGKSKSCGCDKDKVQVGQQYGFWQVLEVKSPRSLCKCLGCNQTTKMVLNRNLQSGRSSSCGCTAGDLRKQTNQEKYGAEYFTQSEERKGRLEEIQEKARSTSMERYGVAIPTQNEKIRNKISKAKQAHTKEQIEQTNAKRVQTCLEKYGVEAVSKIDEIRQKARQTCFEKYGTEMPSTLEEFKEKAKQTCLERYGVDNHSRSEQFQEFLTRTGRRKHLFSTGEGVSNVATEAGVPLSTVIRIFKLHGEEATRSYIENYDNNLYSTEATFLSLLKPYFPKLDKYDKKPREFDINRRPDFRLVREDKVLYVNIDGLRYHSEFTYDKDYHVELAKQFRQNNVRLLQFRSDELDEKPKIIVSMILNYFGMSKKYNARECFIQKLTREEGQSFLEENHLMGTGPNAICYGLFYERELVAAISVRRKSEGLEISRFCTKCGYLVRGGFSKMLKYVEQLHSPSFIESFCDLRYSSGNSYLQCNFKEVSTTIGFQWTDFQKTFNRAQCRANMDDRRLSQAEYAKELGWYKIYDAGQVKYRKDLK